MRSKNVAVFCDGEFWHGKDWASASRRIKTNRSYWLPKIERNIERDRENDAALIDMGWAVMRFWSGDILKNADGIAESIYAAAKEGNR